MLCTPMYHSFFIGGFMRIIDLISFLRNYYGIVNESLKVNKLTHTDIKILFPFIKRGSFDDIRYDDNKVYNGEIIMVHDCKNHVLPYVNPFLKVDVNLIETNNYEEDVLINLNESILDNLSKDELLKLRKHLKKNNQYNEQRKVTNVIRKKKDPKVKQYKIKKMMLRMEEME